VGTGVGSKKERCLENDLKKEGIVHNTLIMKKENRNPDKTKGPEKANPTKKKNHQTKTKNQKPQTTPQPNTTKKKHHSI